MRASWFYSALFGAFLSLGVIGSAAAAPLPCGDHNAIVAALKTRFTEVPVVTGIDQGGRLIEVLAGKSNTWTVLLTLPGGPTCLMDAGTDFGLSPPGRPAATTAPPAQPDPGQVHAR